MFLRLFLGLLGFLASAAPALAQSNDVPGYGDPADFCTQNPRQMLAALDGNWTLQQGAGVAVAGPITIPLPPHAQQSFSLRFNAERGYATLSGEGQQMTMIAGSADELTDVSEFLSQQELEGLVTRGQGCNWGTTPLMVGGKSYPLESFEPWRQDRYIYMVRRAEQNGNYTDICIDDQGVPYIDEAAWNERCQSDPGWTEAGDLKMTLIVKFQSARSGSGLLMFEGEEDGYRYFAMAPITMSR